MYQQKNKNNLALKNFILAEKKGYKSVDVYNSIALNYFLTSDTISAINTLQNALLKYPNNFDLKNNLSKLKNNFQ